MKISNKYILQNFIQNFIIYFGIIFALFTLNYIYYLIRPIIINQPPFIIILQLFLYLTPTVFSLSFPVTLLLTTLLTLGTMKEYGEITILQILGLKKINYTTHLILISITTTMLLIYFNGYTIPKSNKNFRMLYTKFLLSSPKIKFSNNTFVSFENVKIYVNKAESDILKNVYLLNHIDDNTIQTISAKMAKMFTDSYNNIILELYNGRISTIDRKNLSATLQLLFNKYIFIISNKDVSTIFSETKSFREMTNTELLSELQNYTEVTPFVRGILIEYFSRYTLAISTFIFVLLGITISHRLKHYAKPLSFVITILIVWFYYFLYSGSITISQHIENIKFVKSGLYLMLLLLQIPNILFFLLFILLSRIYKE